jgi:dienelactone hydrolase
MYAFGAILILLAADPSTIQGEATFRPSKAAEAQVPERFQLEEARFPYAMTPIRHMPAYTVWAVRFPSPLKAPEPKVNTVYAEYFQPKSAKSRPAVIVLHILGGDFALSRYLAARLADRNVPALFIQLPYYGERRPEGSKFLSADIERTVSAMRQGICDVRRSVAWLQGREEVDPRKIGVTGISLGGIVSSVAASVDPEIRQAVLILAGGGLADILWDMPEPEARHYRDLWIASGRTKADLEALTRPYDPLTYAQGLKGKRILMMAGTVDEVIPPEAARKLWEAAGKPPIEWMPCGHYSAVGFLLPAVRQMVDFFADGP